MIIRRRRYRSTGRRSTPASTRVLTTFAPNLQVALAFNQRSTLIYGATPRLCICEPYRGILGPIGLAVIKGLGRPKGDNDLRASRRPGRAHAVCKHHSLRSSTVCLLCKHTQLVGTHRATRLVPFGHPWSVGVVLASLCLAPLCLHGSRLVGRGPKLSGSALPKGAPFVFVRHSGDPSGYAQIQRVAVKEDHPVGGWE